VLLAACIVGDACLGGASLPWLCPALLLVIPLLLGRYVGEGRLAAFVGAARATQRRRPLLVRVLRGRPRVMQRGGRLVACALAKRPPPVRALRRSTA